MKYLKNYSKWLVNKTYKEKDIPLLFSFLYFNFYIEHSINWLYCCIDNKYLKKDIQIIIKL